MRILVVDDHQDSVKYLSRLLAVHGHDVATAQTLFTAKVMCENGGFDLMICDLGLPDGDGIALAEVMTRCGGKAIALTGRSSPEDIARSMAAGFCAHLTKPVSYEKIIEAISSEPCNTESK